MLNPIDSVPFHPLKEGPLTWAREEGLELGARASQTVPARLYKVMLIHTSGFLHLRSAHHSLYPVVPRGDEAQMGGEQESAWRNHTGGLPKSELVAQVGKLLSFSSLGLQVLAFPSNDHGYSGSHRREGRFKLIKLALCSKKLDQILG